MPTQAVYSLARWLSDCLPKNTSWNVHTEVSKHSDYLKNMDVIIQKIHQLTPTIRDWLQQMVQSYQILKQVHITS